MSFWLRPFPDRSSTDTTAPAKRIRNLSSNRRTAIGTGWTQLLQIISVRAGHFQAFFRNAWEVFFTYSSQQPVSSKAVFEADLALLGEMIRQREVPFQQSDWEAFLSHYRAKSYPAVSHSDTYRNAYHPAYRVLHKSCWDYWPIFAAIDQIMRQKGCGIVSIDGGSGTGKSHLAKQLAAVFPAAIVHMDDFFLQSFQRTPKRLAEPGGNLDYERFAAPGSFLLSKQRPHFLTKFSTVPVVNCPVAER